jgi:hypothetical protein
MPNAQNRVSLIEPLVLIISIPIISAVSVAYPLGSKNSADEGSLENRLNCNLQNDVLQRPYGVVPTA